MARPISVLEVTAEARRELERRIAAATMPAGDSLRAHIALLRSEGFGQLEVASRLGVSAPSVSKWSQTLRPRRARWSQGQAGPRAAHVGGRTAAATGHRPSAPACDPTGNHPGTGRSQSGSDPSRRKVPVFRCSMAGSGWGGRPVAPFPVRPPIPSRRRRRATREVLVAAMQVAFDNPRSASVHRGSRVRCSAEAKSGSQPAAWSAASTTAARSMPDGISRWAMPAQGPAHGPGLPTRRVAAMEDVVHRQEARPFPGRPSARARACVGDASSRSR